MTIYIYIYIYMYIYMYTRTYMYIYIDRHSRISSISNKIKGWYNGMIWICIFFQVRRVRLPTPLWCHNLQSTWGEDMCTMGITSEFFTSKLWDTSRGWTIPWDDSGWFPHKKHGAGTFCNWDKLHRKTDWEIGDLLGFFVRKKPWDLLGMRMEIYVLGTWS